MQRSPALLALVIFVFSVQVHPDLENTHVSDWCLASYTQLYFTETATINIDAQW